MNLTNSFLLAVLGFVLVYKGWRGLDWPGFYREIATERTAG